MGSVVSSSQHRNKLVQRVQGMLELYECPVLIVEGEAPKGSPQQPQAPGRPRYLDTIVCAFTQVITLKVLYSKGQGEASIHTGTLILLHTLNFKFHVKLFLMDFHNF